MLDLALIRVDGVGEELCVLSLEPKQTVRKVLVPLRQLVGERGVEVEKGVSRRRFGRRLAGKDTEDYRQIGVGRVVVGQGEDSRCARTTRGLRPVYVAPPLCRPPLLNEAAHRADPRPLRRRMRSAVGRSDAEPQRLKYPPVLPSDRLAGLGHVQFS
jgi:hypothetical protein